MSHQLFNATDKAPIIVCKTLSAHEGRCLMVKRVRILDASHTTEERKTWRQLIQGLKIGKRLYYAPEIIDCVHKRHKISVKVKPFSISVLKRMTGVNTRKALKVNWSL